VKDATCADACLQNRAGYRELKPKRGAYPPLAGWFGQPFRDMIIARASWLRISVEAGQMPVPDWTKLSGQVVGGPSHLPAELGAYRESNAETIRRAMLGRGAHSPGANPKFGMRLVYNISSAHIPALISAGASAYQNCYDRGRLLGNQPPVRPPLRERVDRAVAEVASTHTSLSVRHSSLYYGALELNGSGVRFFGDVCMVLRPDEVADGSLVLFRNSYDVSCSPVRSAIEVPGDENLTHRNRVAQLGGWAGSWPSDPPDMAVCKILDDGRATTRRMTMAMVSDGLLEDEDYMEVARAGSFGAGDLQELRLNAADAAAEARIADRTRSGPPPSAAEHQWRHRRRAAERAALAIGLKTRVVVTRGRERG
jgi:hypothetical protein